MKTLHTFSERHPIGSSSTISETVYTSGATRRHSWQIWASMIDDLLGSRELIWRLIVRDIRVRYRQSALGYVWAVLPAIATVMLFAYLKTSGTIPLRDTPIPYVAYALWGISMWQLFASCLTAATGSLAAAGSLVTKIHFPKDALVIASIGAPIFDFLVRLVPLSLVFIWSGVTFKWQIVLTPCAIVPIIPLCLGLGFVLSVVNLAFRDIGNALGFVLTLAMFATPVLYPPSFDWPYVLVNFINPVSPLLIASQDLIAYGKLTMPEAFAFSSISSLLICLVGWRFFNLALPRIIHLS